MNCKSAKYIQTKIHETLEINYVFVVVVVVDGSDVEKAPFLAKPVRLTPAWEATNLPNDELNFKGNSST